MRYLLFLFLVAGNGLALAAEEEVLTAKAESPWGAEMRLESVMDWTPREDYRVLATDLRIEPTWKTGGFALGTEFVIHGETTARLDKINLDNTRIFTEMPTLWRGNDASIWTKVEAFLPTNSQKRTEERFITGSAVAIMGDWDYSFGKVEWETNILRNFRSESADLTTSAFSRWEIYQEIYPTIALWKNWDIGEKFRWTRAWSENNARKDIFLAQQLLAYAQDNYRIEAGHAYEWGSGGANKSKLLLNMLFNL